MAEVGRISDLSTGSTGTCTVTLVEGHTLTVESSVAFPLAALIKAEIGNCLWMGAVCSCVSEANGFTVEIQIESFLKDVASVEELAARFRHERAINPKPAKSVPLVSTRRDIT